MLSSLSDNTRKEAYIVTFIVKTRVVSEPDDDLIAKIAMNNIVSNPDGYIDESNIDSVESDTECPYGTFDSDIEFT